MVKRLAPEEIDEHGRRIGYMTPEEFQDAGAEALGFGWQTRLSHGAGLATSSITRYLNGRYPIPKHIAAIMELLVRLRRAGGTLPDDFLPPSYDEDQDFSAPAAQAPKSGGQGTAAARS